MDYVQRLLDLMVQVMLPLALLVAAGAFWPRFFPGAQVAVMRTQLNQLVLYLFYPCILFAIAASTPITGALLTVPVLVGLGTLACGGLLWWLLYRTRIGAGLEDRTRAILMLAGMFGNTFNVGVPVLGFFYGAGSARYAVFNDMLMTMPVIWSLGVWIATRLGAHDPHMPHAPVWKVMLSMPPIWAFVLGAGMQASGIAYPPLIAATRFIGQATIPVIIFVLGLTIPWRSLVPRREILAVAGVKLLVMPALVWAVGSLVFEPMEEAQYGAVVLATTPSMMTALVLADRFRLDHSAAALLIGWSTILFWLSLPVVMGMGLIR